MALEMCIESYGLVVHALETSWWDPALLASRRVRAKVLRTDPASLSAQVRATASCLPYQQSVALWLVDICGCTYEEAALEMGVSQDTIRQSIASGRTTIRTELKL